MTLRCSAVSPDGQRCKRQPHHETSHPDGPAHISRLGQTWRAHVEVAIVGRASSSTSWAEAQARVMQR